ncbi:hypothetical protein INR49_028987 [Caranx melampygus]|nr:hypothetical protein INR49_028987 [Caranx melampygus]
MSGSVRHLHPYDHTVHGTVDLSSGEQSGGVREAIRSRVLCDRRAVSERGAEVFGQSELVQAPDTPSCLGEETSLDAQEERLEGHRGAIRGIVSDRKYRLAFVAS